MPDGYIFDDDLYDDYEAEQRDLEDEAAQAAAEWQQQEEAL